MQKIIVTGGLGFIGRNLISLLLKKKYFVINIDKVSYSSNQYFPVKNKNYLFIRTDINNRKKIINILKKNKPLAIFNLAAETHVDRSIDNPDSFIQSNILGVYNLLESMKKLKKDNINTKLIHISTDEVYGDLKNKKITASEEFPYRPSSPYAASKASGDHLVRSYVRTYKINAIITNCCNNYGPFQFPEKLIPKVINNILKNIPIPIYARGKNIREWIYVDDHCKALYNIMKKGKTGENYNIGSGLKISNINLVKEIIKLISKEKLKVKKKIKIEFVKDRPGHDTVYSLNSRKIRKLTKWSPKYDFKSGLYKTLKWYLDNEEYLKSIKEKNYERRLGLKYD